MSVLEKGSDDDTLTALERAYKNGEHVEEHLDKLVESLSAASRAPIGIGSLNTGHIHQSSHHALWAPISSTIAEQYRAGHVVPALPDNLHLDFSSQEDGGKFCAPEGDLKSTLLRSTSLNPVIAASGAEGLKLCMGHQAWRAWARPLL